MIASAQRAAAGPQLCRNPPAGNRSVESGTSLFFLQPQDRVLTGIELGGHLDRRLAAEVIERMLRKGKAASGRFRNHGFAGPRRGER